MRTPEQPPKHLRIAATAVNVTETPEEAGRVLTMYFYFRKGMPMDAAASMAADLLLEFVKWCERQPLFHIPDSLLDGNKRHTN